MNDWTIHAVMDDPKSGLYNVHTHGLKKHGLMEMMTISDTPEVASYMLNATANAMISGETFDPATKHYFDNEDGSILFEFDIEPPRDNYGEQNMYLDLTWYNPLLKGDPKLKIKNTYGTAKGTW